MKFTKQELDDFFKIDNWKDYYEDLRKKVLKSGKYKSFMDWEKNANRYDYIIFPIVLKEDGYWKCSLHPTVVTGGGVKGVKPLQFFYRNIHFSELMSHCIQYKPEEHKAYLENILFNSNKNVDTTRTTTTTSNK